MTALTDPLELGRTTLPNRIVAAPMERNYCTPEGYLTDVYIDYLTRFADNGVGLIVVEATFVQADGRGRQNQLGMHRDECIPGVARLAEAVHASGSLLALELNHSGRTSQRITTGLPVVAPSAVPCEVVGGDVPRALTEPEIYEIADSFARAAQRSVEAGVDVIVIHAAHGYLIHQFLSPFTNRRSDRWAEPAAFLALVLERVRAAVPDATIGLRFSSVDGSDGGYTPDQQFDVISNTRLDLVDFLDVSAGSYESGQWTIQSGEWAPGFLAEFAQRYRSLGLPVGMAGRINSPEVAAQLVGDGVTDFVSVGRALHADPRWASVALGRSATYRPCIACNVCIDGLGVGAVVCSVNPDVGRGFIPLQAVRVRERVGVIGAGPAGLAAAITLAEADVAVVLFERTAAIGGQMALAGTLKSNPEYASYLTWAGERLRSLGVDVRLETDATAGVLEAENLRAVLVASGATGIRPSAVAGADSPRVHDLREWLSDSPGTPESVTIWGGDGPAMAVADHLASSGSDVLVVASTKELAPELGRRSRILVLPRLDSNPAADIRYSSVIDAIGDDSVLVSDSEVSAWSTHPGPVLVSQGLVPTSVPVGALPSTLIGDAAGGPLSSIRNAIVSGTDAARTLCAELSRAS